MCISSGNHTEICFVSLITIKQFLHSLVCDRSSLGPVYQVTVLTTV